MANKIQKFISETFGNIRGIYLGGECWFVGRDVAQALGYKDTKSALIDHVFDDYKRVLNAKTIAQMASDLKGGKTPPLEMLDMNSPRGMLYLKEAGLYQLIFSSKMPNAKEFQRWIFEEVLPELRRNGMYDLLRENIRNDGKKTRRELTDVIKDFLDWLKENDELDREPRAWYVAFTNLANKFAGVEKYTRENATPLQLLRLQDAEDKIAAELEAGMKQNKSHHDIWLACQEKLEK